MELTDNLNRQSRLPNRKLLSVYKTGNNYIYFYLRINYLLYYSKQFHIYIPQIYIEDCDFIKNGGNRLENFAFNNYINIFLDDKLKKIRSYWICLSHCLVESETNQNVHDVLYTILKGSIEDIGWEGYSQDMVYYGLQSKGDKILLYWDIDCFPYDLAPLNNQLINRKEFMKLTQIYISEYVNYMSNLQNSEKFGEIFGKDFQNILNWQLKNTDTEKYQKSYNKFISIGVIEDCPKELLKKYHFLEARRPDFLKLYEEFMAIDTSDAFDFEIEKVFDNTWDEEKQKKVIEEINKDYGGDAGIRYADINEVGHRMERRE